MTTSLTPSVYPNSFISISHSPPKSEELPEISYDPQKSEKLSDSDLKPPQQPNSSTRSEDDRTAIESIQQKLLGHIRPAMETELVNHNSEQIQIALKIQASSPDDSKIHENFDIICNAIDDAVTKLKGIKYIECGIFNKCSAIIEFMKDIIAQAKAINDNNEKYLGRLDNLESQLDAILDTIFSNHKISL